MPDDDAGERADERRILLLQRDGIGMRRAGEHQDLGSGWVGSRQVLAAFRRADLPGREQHDPTGRRLEQRSFRVLSHRLIPPNEGGISYGQVAVAAALAT